jgi:glutamate--cysteine ligase
MVAISRAGLAARNCQDDTGTNEAFHLDTLDRILERGTTPAEEKLKLYHDRWSGSVDPIYAEYAY